ncbi:hypothetical protein PHLCEN_2v8600 [Hermanssonia centrifuga]|uniref:Ribosome recycling factor domain-containing protein n=1 Tax=Hermanssonia centrifuga TaxID=98765 RepID=A0A2R6NT47_9APHY|nr:hypothetical protein PHLCEN_2v8600 [Hermanssonia centrifuga]
MSLLRNAIVRSVNGAQRPSHSPLRLTRLSAPLLPFNRTYASKNKKKESRADNVTSDQKKGGKGGGITTDQLIPGSQRFVTSPEYISTEKKMKTAIDYYRKEVAALEMRASGRVTPAVLSPVRVMLPDHRGGDGKGVRLEEIATVGVREGTTLLITVFEEHTLKYVEKGIYDAEIPGIVPHRQDMRTIKIPFPKPTVEARQALYAAAHRFSEDIRVQIRKARDVVVKPFKKHEPEYEEFHKLGEKYLSEVDKILADMKKVTGSK